MKGNRSSDMNIDDVSFEKALSYISGSVGALLIVDGNTDRYKSVIRRGIFLDYINETGTYNELIEKLWFHFNNSADSVVENYHVFIPTTGKFIGKYSRRINISVNNITHVVQMTIYPIEDENSYLFILDELDKSQYREETMTNKKVSTIQNTYLFSMYVDLVKDTTESISISEISDETTNAQIKYSEWRMMIVNMIWPEDQPMFLERSDPEYLRKNLAPGRTSSFDCLMMNLEGKYIWVKLIFSRSETNNDKDFRFVYMVQNINDETQELMSTLKKYEDLASKDPLTGVYNHGRIETELHNAVEQFKKNDSAVSVLMLDIDFFKNVNDGHGHSVGDETLIHFTKLVSAFFNEKKTVLGRWGGEEFVVVCYDESKEEIEKAAEELRIRIENEPFNKVGGITCSIGTTSIRENDSFDTAFERLDQALYAAKSAGRNCVRSL